MSIVFFLSSFPSSLFSHSWRFRVARAKEERKGRVGDFQQKCANLLRHLAHAVTRSSRNETETQRVSDVFEAELLEKSVANLVISPWTRLFVRFCSQKNTRESHVKFRQLGLSQLSCLVQSILPVSTSSFSQSLVETRSRVREGQEGFWPS